MLGQFRLCPNVNGLLMAPVFPAFCGASATAPPLSLSQQPPNDYRSTRYEQPNHEPSPIDMVDKVKPRRFPREKNQSLPPTLDKNLGGLALVRVVLPHWRIMHYFALYESLVVMYSSIFQSSS